DPAFIANKNWFSSGNPGWGVFSQGGGNFRMQMTDSKDTSLRIAGTRTNIVRDGIWHHIVVTLQVGGTRNIYLDGALNDSVPNVITGGIDTFTFTNGLGQPLAINIGEDGTGGYNDSTAVPPPAKATGGDSAIINAAIDDVGFWRRLVTPQEVAAIYNAGQQGKDFSNVGALNLGKVNVTLQGNNVNFTWTGGTGIRLQRSPSLSPTAWQDVAGTDGQSSATVAISGAGGYFRLLKP
ncbi:MAG: hypothetical protein DME26_12815, partial [Verrucomicrobia bacterium]